MKKHNKPPETRDDVKTYRRIRNMIGFLGIGLPLVLFVISFIHFFETPPQPSISDYYYTNCREIFTGVLCAVGLFLIRYQGTTNKVFWKNDKLMTNIAGTMALGVALMPTNPVTCDEKIYTFLPICAPWTGAIHYLFAATFFLILANISCNVFVIGQKKTKDIPVSMLNENNIYRLCGWVIFVSVLLIPVCMWLDLFPRSTFWLETVALIAFGSSWLIKGRVFGQSGATGRVIYREHNN